MTSNDFTKCRLRWIYDGVYGYHPICALNGPTPVKSYPTPWEALTNFSQIPYPGLRTHNAMQNACPQLYNNGKDSRVTSEPRIEILNHITGPTV